MASKQYISIIRLFDHCGIPSASDFNLSRAKKQLQAEFGIAEGGFIEADGNTYTKQDVFEEMDRPDFPRRLGFHRQIWMSKQLLQLLEKNTASFNFIGDELVLFQGNAEFDEFFSPYFAGPFNYSLRTLLADLNFIEAGHLLAYEGFLQMNEREEAFRPLRIFLEENLRWLRNTNGENYSMMRSKIGHWADKEWYLFFNNMPHEFYEEKVEIITKLINLSVAIQKSQRSDCRSMSDQLIRLKDIPESLRQIIVSNHAVYSGAGSSSPSSSGWKAAGWIAFILIAIGRIASTDGCESERPGYDYKFSTPTFKLDSSTYKIYDSMFSPGDSNSPKIVPYDKYEK